MSLSYDMTTQAAMEIATQEKLAKLAALRDSDLYQSDALVIDGRYENRARYMGTRRKDGYHYMEVRDWRGGVNCRRYVRPDLVKWTGDTPTIKWGDKMKDFI